MDAQPDDPGTRGVPHYLHYLIAFIGGLLITGIEISLGRLLAPYFGASLVVWAAIIGSVIMAVSIGYVLGGILIDKRPSVNIPIAALLFGAVLGAVLGVFTPAGLRLWMDGVFFHGIAYWGRLAAILLMFGVSCLVLAMISPAVLRLAVVRHEQVGVIAGRLYGLGSLGSVLGILLPAIWWIPNWGVKATFLFLGALGLIPALIARRHLSTRVRIASLAALCVLALAYFVPSAPRAVDISGAQIIYEGETPLQHVRILEKQYAHSRARWLQFDDGWASQSVLVEPSLLTYGVWDWLSLCALHASVDDDALDVLIIGFAAGSISRIINERMSAALPNVRIVGVEIDRNIVNLGERYFGLNPASAEIHVADGRSFMQSDSRKYDLILLGAFRPPSIPAHLATVEYFSEVKKRLSPGGIAVINVFTVDGPSQFFDKAASTWSAVFDNPKQIVMPAANGFASRLFVGGHGDNLNFNQTRIDQLPQGLQQQWRTMATRTRPLDAISDVRPWTDDLSDIELLTDSAYRNARPAIVTLPIKTIAPSS